MYSYYNQQELSFEQPMLERSLAKSKKAMYSGEQPMSVIRRNERERNRVRQVNDGYVTLREHIPQFIVSALSNGGRGASKKLSKVDTLRLAVEYIRRLQDAITDYDSDASSTQSSVCGSPEPNMFYQYQNNSDYSQYSQSSSSPTPSLLSESSSDAHYFQQQHQEIEQPQFNQQMYNCSINEPSEDEELLDCISYWQDQ